MKHSRFPETHQGSLSPVQTRLIRLLRLWALGPDGQQVVWSELCRDLRPPRARTCLQSLERLLALLHRHGWEKPQFLSPGSKGVSLQEASLAHFVFAATEQRREEAMQHALLLASPTCLLELLRCAEMTGLPLLCADCRARISGTASDLPLTFQ